ncbi:putative sodium:potassium-exchanging ATPase [Trypoxylus dichotomus]
MDLMKVKSIPHSIASTNLSDSFAVVRKSDRVEDIKKDIDINDHMLTIDEIQNRYSTNIETGLTVWAAARLLHINGPNCLIPPAAKSRWLILSEYVFGGFNVLLWIGAFLSIFGFVMTYYQLGEMEEEQLYLGMRFKLDDVSSKIYEVDSINSRADRLKIAAVLLVSVILITGLFGFYQEAANSLVMEGFKKMMPKSAFVIRDGVYSEIACEELVVGDLVHVRAGYCVPGDLRIISANLLKVDNSSITGESEPQTRVPESTDPNPLETANLGFYGTNVVEGSDKYHESLIINFAMRIFVNMFTLE